MVRKKAGVRTREDNTQEHMMMNDGHDGHDGDDDTNYMR